MIIIIFIFTICILTLFMIIINRTILIKYNYYQMVFGENLLMLCRLMNYFQRVVSADFNLIIALPFKDFSKLTILVLALVIL